jgi:hypothetical protein
MRALKQEAEDEDAIDADDADGEDAEDAYAGESEDEHADEAEEVDSEDGEDAYAGEAEDEDATDAEDADGEDVEDVDAGEAEYADLGVVREVWTDEIKEVEAIEVVDAAPVKKSRRKLKLAAAVVMVIIVVPLLYFVIIPRTELSLKIYYNESVMNQINFDTELRNGGTVPIDDITLEISVVNSTDAQMGHQNNSVQNIGPFSAPKDLDAISFRGSQYEQYTIIIDLHFSSQGRDFSNHWSHQTEEPWMNQDFTETVSGL